MQGLTARNQSMSWYVFRFQGCFWEESRIQEKEKRIYNLDTNFITMILLNFNGSFFIQRYSSLKVLKSACIKIQIIVAVNILLIPKPQFVKMYWAFESKFNNNFFRITSYLIFNWENYHLNLILAYWNSFWETAYTFLIYINSFLHLIPNAFPNYRG